jgi:N6-adenosine-specific RNA methylase IME4
MTLQHHPAADSFPMMGDKRFQELREDIATHGQREEITLCDGMILDGRNRYKACLELNIKPKTKDYEGDPYAYVWSLNGERRDLPAGQRYQIWKYVQEKSEAWQAEQERIRDEANRKRSEAAKQRERTEQGTFEPVGEQTVPELDSKHPERQAKAAASNTNAGAVARGDKLAKDRPDLAEKVRLGEITETTALREMRKDETMKNIQAFPSDKYRIIYADPPWKYNDSQAGDISEKYGPAEKHYPAMSLPELKALNIQEISLENSVLFLWATCPLLEESLELCRAWGFKYKAQFVWDKVKHNWGHYNSVRHELLLICTKGSCTPDNNKLFDSVQTIERGTHSRKPEEFREIIDVLYPAGNRIELFARGEIPEHWDKWGNE